MVYCIHSITERHRWFIPLPLILLLLHDDAIKWKHFPRYWPFVWGIHRSPVNSPHKGQWCGGLMFSSICTRINCWVNNGEAGDFRRHCAHYDVTVMSNSYSNSYFSSNSSRQLITKTSHLRRQWHRRRTQSRGWQPLHLCLHGFPGSFRCRCDSSLDRRRFGEGVCCGQGKGHGFKQK